MKFICSGLQVTSQEIDEASVDPEGLSWQVIADWWSIHFPIFVPKLNQLNVLSSKISHNVQLLEDRFGGSIELFNLLSLFFWVRVHD